MRLSRNSFTRCTTVDAGTAKIPAVVNVQAPVSRSCRASYVMLARSKPTAYSGRSERLVLPGKIRDLVAVRLEIVDERPSFSKSSQASGKQVKSRLRGVAVVRIGKRRGDAIPARLHRAWA